MRFKNILKRHKYNRGITEETTKNLKRIDALIEEISI